MAGTDEHDTNDGNEPVLELMGLTFPSLPDGWTPFEGILLAKCFDEKGEPRWACVQTEGLIDQEVLGALDLEYSLQKRESMKAVWDEVEADGGND